MFCQYETLLASQETKTYFVIFDYIGMNYSSMQMISRYE